MTKSYLTCRRRLGDGGSGGSGGSLNGGGAPSAYCRAWFRSYSRASWKSQYASKSPLARSARSFSEHRPPGRGSATVRASRLELPEPDKPRHRGVCRSGAADLYRAFIGDTLAERPRLSIPRDDELVRRPPGFGSPGPAPRRASAARVRPRRPSPDGHPAAGGRPGRLQQRPPRTRRAPGPWTAESNREWSGRSGSGSQGRQSVSDQRLIGAHLPAMHPERRETRPGRCSGCLARFAVDVRLPSPATCPEARAARVLAWLGTWSRPAEKLPRGACRRRGAGKAAGRFAKRRGAGPAGVGRGAGTVRGVGGSRYPAGG